MSGRSYGRRGHGPNTGHRGGRGRGRGRPPGLSGRDIGMYYRDLGIKKKKEKEKNEVVQMTCIIIL